MKLIKVTFIIFIAFFLINANNDFLYFFKNVNIENQDIDSYKAKELGISKAINNKFNLLINNLSAQSININVNEINHNNYLKNIVVKKEIVTENKYIAELDIIFDKEKIINFFKKNEILFSDTVSPDFLLLASYNFDGSNILWEENSWNNSWKNNQLITDQLKFNLPNNNNKNKILLSSSDIEKLNINNIDKILKYYNKKNAILIHAQKIYSPKDGQIYIKLIITSYISENKILENIINDSIPLNKLDNNYLLNDLTNIAYNKIFYWWKSSTITYFKEINDIECLFYPTDIQSIKKLKKILLSISHIDEIYIKSINTEKINIHISYYGNSKDLKNIFNLYNIKMKNESKKCLIIDESI